MSERRVKAIRRAVRTVLANNDTSKDSPVQALVRRAAASARKPVKFTPKMVEKKNAKGHLLFNVVEYGEADPVGRATKVFNRLLGRNIQNALLAA